MCLPVAQVDRFYTVWRPLLFFVNQQRELVPGLDDAGQMPDVAISDVLEIRNTLWNDDSLLEAYIAQNPAQLSDQDLALVQSWKHRRSGKFIIFKLLKKASIFIDEKENEVFAVKGLYSPLEEIVSFVPVFVEAVLLPYGNEIIYDGLLQSYNVMFGSGIRGNLNAIYADARERDAVITSLTPPAQPISMEDQIAKAEGINAKVLQAFQKYLYQSGQSPKIVERDLATVKALAAVNLQSKAGIFSLREIDPEAMEHCLSSLPETAHKPAITGYKRFVKFMRDTGRLDWDEAEDLLLILKSS